MMPTGSIPYWRISCCTWERNEARGIAKCRDFGSHQNSKYPPAAARRGLLSASPSGSKPTTPRRFSQAAWFSAGSEPTRSRIICQAAMLRAPSGGGPIARETEHCGQKQMRCAADFCRGLIPTVCANMYMATDLCPASSSRLQRRQCRFSKGPFPGGQLRPERNSVSPAWWVQVCKGIPTSSNAEVQLDRPQTNSGFGWSSASSAASEPRISNGLQPLRT
jgi:hypothetical protein